MNTTDSNIYVGDSTDVPNAVYRSFLSFDLSSLLAALTSSNVLSATLTARQRLVLGTPYSSLNVGSSYLLVDHVIYGAVLSASDFDAPVLSAQGNFITTATIGNYSKSMLSAVKADLSANRTRTQYRLRFARQTNGDGSADLVHIYASDNATDKPRLEITYLIP
ncbi:hypothetical protein [Deinococcus frigens]|uniref:hypothetical protein n=1 Tax=Deinococcus frigens TaxID=249403 RepID=UPI0004968733|nr:hypothetical protein [Deinococcus frigens]